MAGTDLFAKELLAARRDNRKLEVLPVNLVPADEAAAWTVQDLVVDSLGEPVLAYKVFQAGDGPGNYGQILKSTVFTTPARFVRAAPQLGVEGEIAFRIGRDLPGRPDGKPYGKDEVADAIDGVLPVIEILESRYATFPDVPLLLAIADNMSSGGLVTGPLATDWRTRDLAHLHAPVEVAGRQAFDGPLKHPSGEPFHPLPWLANRLAGRGKGLRKGQIVTTGSCTGFTFAKPGEPVTATFESLGSATMVFSAS